MHRKVARTLKIFPSFALSNIFSKGVPEWSMGSFKDTSLALKTGGGDSQL
jgi:hypothetical protein